ncbi:molybdopterin-guanine dinucleotide biosynthesis protein B [Jeotgalibacillus proteolyticus]|uniref:Molybdopterin-guanine dinucleotide biosynthesis protein B n=1 Tax=Jeotgalibacillus proteolyticus TaxID=2082395 RepID=A0A2S5GCT5_9BACL|nr:molybdopterin-guanine dinucleotide biosynthesis protein B [Jeotgalibacillus proteolyticus]PPA70713.1 molybdopterin-guanine dinucleotide biosynthesis protein B [Jeotgalibacillus proteolyticus]
MAMVGPPVLQVIGYQNSGKTSVAETMIAKASGKGLKIGSIKHHGHGGIPDGSIKTKDSSRHLHAGAAFSAVEGGGTVQLTNADHSWSVEQLLDLYQQLDLDGILLEGFKRAPYPKVVLLRKKEDFILLDEMTNIVLVIVDDLLSLEHHSTPSFLFSEKEKYGQWFIEYIKEAL